MKDSQITAIIISGFGAIGIVAAINKIFEYKLIKLKAREFRNKELLSGLDSSNVEDMKKFIDKKESLRPSKKNNEWFFAGLGIGVLTGAISMYSTSH